MKGSHIPLPLKPAEPYSVDYFIPHSGVAEAIDAVSSAIEELQENSSEFRMFFVHGPEGVGKSHLLAVLGFMAESSRVSFYSVEGVDDHDDWIMGFIDRYEKARREGGLLLVTSRSEPQAAFSNPHSGSRLRVARALRLGYPSEEELAPIIKSIAEKHNLRLSERMLSFLVKRLPLQPLSFDNIFSRINELSLEKGGRVTEGVFREVAEERQSKTSDDMLALKK